MMPKDKLYRNKATVWHVKLKIFHIHGSRRKLITRDSIPFSRVPINTANILDAKTATLSCVMHPMALQMRYVQLLAATNF